MFEVPMGVLTKDFDLHGPLSWNFSDADAENALVWHKDNLTEDGINGEKLAELAKSGYGSVKYVMKRVYDELGLAGLAEFMDLLEKQFNASRKVEMAYDHVVKVSHDPTAEHVPEWELAGDMDEIYACVSKYAEFHVPYSTLMESWEMVLSKKFIAEAYLKTAETTEDPVLKERYIQRSSSALSDCNRLMSNHSGLFEAIRIAGGVC